MAWLAHALPLLLNVAIGALVFAIGLNAQPSDLTLLWRHPRLLLRALLAVDVLVPVAAFAILLALRPGAAVAIGVLAMAVSPGAPFAPLKALKLGGRLPYAYSLLAAVSALAIGTVPLSLEVIAHVFDVEEGALVTPLAVARLLGRALLLPLVVGVLVRRFLPGVADLVGKPVARVANVLILVAFVPIVLESLPALLGLGARAYLVIALVTLASLASGHLLGGPRIEDRTALAVSCSLRHPGLALLIAKVDFPEHRVAPVVLAYILVAAIASIPYTKWRQRELAASAAADDGEIAGRDESAPA